MSRKNVLRPSVPISLGQSLAANFISPATVIEYLDNCSYQINVTTTNSTGTFVFQGSIDFVPTTSLGPQPNAGHWVDIPLGGPTASPTVSAANDSILVDLNQLPFNAIRVSYTSTIAGTGTCDIYVMAKEIGG